MLRERNAELNKSIPPKPITLHKTSSTPYFNFMKDFANRQGIQYAIQPITLEPPKLPYLQYTLPLEQTNGSQMLCRRLLDMLYIIKLGINEISRINHKILERKTLISYKKVTE
uniref:Uncharacterized protein n=1 Tax=Panagrolaimus sp. ES5 TaxID=591445 RepID=A0AC34GU23_9BILA